MALFLAKFAMDSIVDTSIHCEPKYCNPQGQSSFKAIYFTYLNTNTAMTYDSFILHCNAVAYVNFVAVNTLKNR